MSPSSNKAKSVTPQQDDVVVPKRTRTLSLSLRRKPKQASFSDLPPSPAPPLPRGSPERRQTTLPPLTLSPTALTDALLPPVDVSSSPRQSPSRGPLHGLFDSAASGHPRMPSSPSTPTGPLPSSSTSPIDNAQGMLLPPQPAFLSARRVSSNSSFGDSGYSSNTGSVRSYVSSAPSTPQEEYCEQHALPEPTPLPQERSHSKEVISTSRVSDSGFKGFGRRLFGRTTGVSARSPSSSSSSASGTTQYSPPLTPTTPPRAPYTFGGAKGTLDGSLSQLPPLGAAATAIHSVPSSVNGSIESPSTRSSHTSLRNSYQPGEPLPLPSLPSVSSVGSSNTARVFSPSSYMSPQPVHIESAVDDSDFLRAVLNYDGADESENQGQARLPETPSYMHSSYQLSEYGPTRGFPSSATFGLSGAKRLPLAQAREMERREHLVHSTRPKLRNGLFRRDSDSESEDDYGSDNGESAEVGFRSAASQASAVPSSFRRRIDGRKRMPLGAPRLSRPESPISDMSHSTGETDQSFHSATGGVGESLPRQPGLDSAPKRALYTCTLVKVHPHLGSILPLPIPTLPDADTQYPRSINSASMLASHSSTTTFTRSLPIAVARTAVMRKLRREQLELETEVEISWFQRKYGGDGFTAEEVMKGIAQRPSSSPEALAKPPGAGMDANEASRAPNGIRAWAMRKSFAATHVIRLAGSSAALPVRRPDAPPEALEHSARICVLAGITPSPKPKTVGVRVYKRPVPKPVREKVPAPWLADPKTRLARVSMLPPAPAEPEEREELEYEDSSEEEDDTAPEEEIPLAVIVAQRRERERAAAVAAEAQAIKDRQMREERAEAARRAARDAERLAEKNRRKLVEARERRAKTEHSTVLQSHSYGAGNAAAMPVRKPELLKSPSQPALHTSSRRVSRSTSQPTLQPSPALKTLQPSPSSKSKTLHVSTSQHQLRSPRRETSQLPPPSPSTAAAHPHRSHRTSTLPSPVSPNSLHPSMAGAPFLSPPTPSTSPRPSRSPKVKTAPLLSPPSPLIDTSPSTQFNGLLGQQLRQQQMQDAQAMWALQQQQQAQQQMLMMEQQRRSMMMGAGAAGMQHNPYFAAQQQQQQQYGGQMGFRPLVALEPGAVPPSAHRRF